MENTPFLYYPVKNPINQSNLFGAPENYAASTGQKGHPGIDFECPSGTTVLAPCDGDALYVTDEFGGCGIWMRVPSHTTPEGNLILWHMYPKDAPGFPYSISTEQGVYTPVKAGQLLGYSDNSGYPQESNGPHLHVGWMPCEIRQSDGAIVALNPDNGYMGCVDPMPFFNGKYAEDIALEQQVVEKSASVVSLVAQATDQQIPHEEKLSILEKIEQFIETLIP